MLLKVKCEQLANLIKESKRIVALTGAGISTSCGIPDFRGPNGVWTLEKIGKKPDVSVSFEEAVPSYAHYALVELNRIGKLQFLISQNIDGLHIRSGFPVNRLAELHGNMFVEKCNSCLSKVKKILFRIENFLLFNFLFSNFFSKHINSYSVKTIGLKPTGKKCLKPKPKGNCR